MLGVPRAVPEARCLSAAGLQPHCPHPGRGMGSSFSKGLTPPAVPRVLGRRGVLSSCPTQQVYCPALPPCLLSTPEHLSSACCSQARLPLGGYEPFRRSGSLWEVRIPLGGQAPFGRSGSPPSPSSSSANATSAEPSWQLHRAAARSHAHAASFLLSCACF